MKGTDINVRHDNDNFITKFGELDEGQFFIWECTLYLKLNKKTAQEVLTGINHRVDSDKTVQIPSRIDIGWRL